MQARLSAFKAAAILLVALAACENAAATELLGDTAVHDPSLWIGGGVQYVFSTGPGLQRLRSVDGQTWLRLAPVFNAANKPAWWDAAVPAHRGLDVWAPKLFQHRGRFWVMYSISTFGKNVSAIGLASAAAPDSTEWKDEGQVLRSEAGDNFNAIDPDVFIAADGRLWLSYGSFWDGIRLGELDANTLRPIGETSFIARHKSGIEAPTLMQRGAWFYLFVSWDKCCIGVNSSYNIRVGRAAAPTGPFVDQDGRAMLDGGGTLVERGGERWRGPGHQDVFGNTLARHAYDAQADGKSKLRLSELQWSADGWPSL